MITKEVLERFKDYDGKDAIIKVYGVTYEAHDIEVVGEYLIFQDKFNRRVMVDIKKVISISEGDFNKDEEMDYGLGNSKYNYKGGQ